MTGTGRSFYDEYYCQLIFRIFKNFLLISWDEMSKLYTCSGFHYVEESHMGREIEYEG